MHFNTSLLDRGSQEICNALNNYYCNIGVNLVQLLRSCGTTDFTRFCPLPNPSSMFCKPTEPGEILRIIMSFKNNKSPGTDNIGHKLLKAICTEILSP